VRTIPYWVIPFVLLVWLTARHLSSPASGRSKRVIAGLDAISVPGFVFWPGPGIALTMFQTAVCLTIAFYTLLRAAPAPTPDDPWPKF